MLHMHAYSVAQSCPTLSDPMDCSLPGSSIHGIFQARVLEWGASPVQLLVTPRTIAHESPLFMGFSRQEYWSGLPVPPPGDLPDLGIEPASPASRALADRFFTTEPPGNPSYLMAKSLSSQINYYPQMSSRFTYWRFLS